MSRIGALLIAAWLLLPAASVVAQESQFFVSASVASASAESSIHTGERRAASPGVAVAFKLREYSALELSIAWLETMTERSSIFLEMGESALFVSTEALPITLRYNQAFPTAAEGLTPFVSAGLVWARVQDTVEADTPPETITSGLFGFEVSGGVTVLLMPRVSAFMQGGYRRLERAEPTPGFDLTGSIYSIGVRYGL